MLSSVTVNGQNPNVPNNTGGAVTLSHTFAATDTRTATNIVIKTQPTKLAYTHGDPLDLTGLAVTLTFDDASTDDEAAADFTAKNITANPAHGTHLIRSTHNNQPVMITYGSLPQLTTGNLTVNKAPGTFGAHAAVNTIYTPGLRLSNVTLPAGYAWSAPSTSLNAGNNQPFAATYTDPSGNYESASGTIIVNVAKAIGAAVSAPTLNTSTHNSITINPITVSTGQSIEYVKNSTNAVPLTGWQAGTIFGGLNAGTTYYFFARSVGNGNYETGAASTGAAIATKQYTENEIIGYWVDDTGELSVGNGGQGSAVTVQYGGSVTFTADGAGYSSQSWMLNGNAIGTGASYTFDTADDDKEAGRNYVIGLTVQKGGKFYFIEFTVTVVGGQLFTVAFSANGGSGTMPDAQTAIAGSSIILPSGSGLTMSGYAFGGWNTNIAGTETNYSAGSPYTPVSNVTLYAKWTPVFFTVAFNANGGSGTMPNAQTAIAGSSITLPSSSLTMSGYTFGGWNTNSAGTGANYNAGDSYTVNSSVTLYARWIYTVVFNSNGGSGTVPTAQVIPGSSITLPSGDGLTRNGYIFSGWNTNADGMGTNYDAGASYTVNNSTTTLYARWIWADGSEAVPFPLVVNTWTDGSITSNASGSAVWYSFNVTSGTIYYVWWNDRDDGNSAKTLDVKVSASYSSGTSIFSSIDFGWTNPRSFTANISGTVKVKVEPYTSGRTGTFAVAYSTNSTRPSSTSRNTRTVTIDMYDSYNNGWDGNGALRINVNGVDIATDVKVQTTSSGTNTPSNQGSTSWSGSNALIYRLRNTSGTTGSNYLTNTANGALLGSFTVQ
jgi:uncharacterized repeat protein (TIGR02543 family)